MRVQNHTTEIGLNGTAYAANLSFHTLCGGVSIIYKTNLHIYLSIAQLLGHCEKLEMSSFETRIVKPIIACGSNCVRNRNQDRLL